MYLLPCVSGNPVVVLFLRSGPADEYVSLVLEVARLFL